MPWLTVLGLLIFSTATLAHAQSSAAAERSVVLKLEAPAKTLSFTEESASPSRLLRRENNERRPLARLVFGGIGGTALGTASGVSLGYLLFDRNAFIPLGSLLVGSAGILAGGPLGVHLANDRRGSYLLDLLASASALVGGAFLSGKFLSEHSVLLTLSVPVAFQLGAAIIAERATAR